MKKVIGTFVPLSALWSTTQKPSVPTFATGRLFLKWLKKTRQHAWQLLPLHQNHLAPNGAPVASPYRGYGVGLDPRYLSPEASAKMPTRKDMQAFLQANKRWLPDYALFCAIRDKLGTDNWTLWPKGLRARRKKDIAEWTKKLAEDIQTHIHTQWRLAQDFQDLAKTAKTYDIELIGDLSFFLPLESPLVWVFQKYFQIPTTYKLQRVSGVFHKSNSHKQRHIWGHPLYAWHKNNALQNLQKLWDIRISNLSCFYNTIRIDNAVGLYYSWAMSTNPQKQDITIKGPGKKLLTHIVQLARKHNRNIICEDLGSVYLDILRHDMHKLHVPGLYILRFAYNEVLHSVSQRHGNPLRFPRESVAYSTTHDSETLMGYLNLLTPAELKILCHTTGVRWHKNKKILAQRLKTRMFESPAKRVIIPIQDWLLTSERINIPGTENLGNETNWQYRTHVPIEQLPTNNLYTTT